jgi:hypothetical protein
MYQTIFFKLFYIFFTSSKNKVWIRIQQTARIRKRLQVNADTKQNFKKETSKIMCNERRRPDEVALAERAAENGAKRACAFVLLQQGQHPAPVATLRATESLQLLSMHSHLAKEQKLEMAKKKKIVGTKISN